jgi:NADPH-dependent curcumin reductase
MPNLQKAWTIQHYVVDELKGTELALVDKPVREIEKGQVLIKTLLLSLDPSTVSG